MLWFPLGLKLSSEIENFKRATHQGPMFFFWGILEVESEIGNGKRDGTFVKIRALRAPHFLTKNQPKEEALGRPFARKSRPKLRQGSQNPGKKQAFQRGHPWPEGADVHDPKGFPKTSVRKTLGWILAPYFRPPSSLVSPAIPGWKSKCTLLSAPKLQRIRKIASRNSYLGKYWSYCGIGPVWNECSFPVVFRLCSSCNANCWNQSESCWFLQTTLKHCPCNRKFAVIPALFSFSELISPRLTQSRFLGRGCDEALFSEKKGFSVKRGEAIQWMGVW